MRALPLLLVAAGCGGSPRTQRGVATANREPSCAEAAVGLEQATRGVRAPDSSLVVPMRARCNDDRWPLTAVACFAHMTEGDLGRCARALPDDARTHMFAIVLNGGVSDRAAIVITRARLDGLAVGVATCDRFVAAVSAVLTCEQMPLDARVQLGNETVDFWDLPTHGLSEGAQRRMENACGASLASLEQQARDVGCML